MKKIKKCFQYLCVAELVILSFIISYKSVAKGDTVTFSYWYSDYDYMGYWEEPPKVYLTHLSGGVNIMSYLNKAVNAWSNEGIESSITMAASNADIKFYSGERSELIAMGFLYKSDYIGLTSFDSYTTVIDTKASYYGVRRLNSVSVSVCKEAGIKEDDEGNEYFTEEPFQNTVLHEYSHALGWMGHTGYTNAVMFAESRPANITLTKWDINQLKQIYDAMN